MHCNFYKSFKAFKKIWQKDLCSKHREIGFQLCKVSHMNVTLYYLHCYVLHQVVLWFIERRLLVHLRNVFCWTICNTSAKYICVMEKISAEFCIGYPMLTVTCKRIIYRRVEKYWITGSVLHKIKYINLYFSWIMHGKKINSHNNRCWYFHLMYQIKALMIYDYIRVPLLWHVLAWVYDKHVRVKWL